MIFHKKILKRQKYKKAHWKVSNLINKSHFLRYFQFVRHFASFSYAFKTFYSRLLRHHKIVYIELMISTRVEIGISAQFDLVRIFANWSFFYILIDIGKVYDLRCQFSVYSHIFPLCAAIRDERPLMCVVLLQLLR